MNLKLLSFNIRCSNDPDGHSIPERACRVRQILKTYAPDVICMQEYHQRWEPSWHILDDADYEEMKVDRGDGEGNVLRWRKDRFTALKQGHFWFGDDPGAASVDWDEKYHKPRICVYAVLQEKQTGKVFICMNLHYGFGDAGHKKNAKLLYEYSGKLGDDPVVIAGDFNLTPDAVGYRAMAEYFTDANPGVQDATFHNYGKAERLIDYCFVGQGAAPCSYTVIKDTFDGKYPSDHYPILVELRL